MGILIVLLYSCQNAADSTSFPSQGAEQLNQDSQILHDYRIKHFTNWILVRLKLTLEETETSPFGDEIFRVIRTNPDSSSYGTTPTIRVEDNKYYRTGILVKKGDTGDYLGLRIVGNYPNRVDAVFDLKKGVVEGVNQFGSFKHPRAYILKQENNWYYCVLEGLSSAESIKIIFGPTNVTLKTDAWESPTKQLNDLLFVPSTLKLEQIEYRQQN